MQVDINCDMGESFGAYSIGADEELLPCISSANIACGFHGGDPMVMDRTVEKAVEHGVAVGCHPSFPDLMGFGRRPMTLSSAEIENYMLYQLGALWAFTKAHKTDLVHFKAHGALSNMAYKDAAIAQAIVKGVARFSRDIIVVAPMATAIVTAGKEAGLVVVENVSVDRAYGADGLPVSRKLPGAVIHDPKAVVERAVRMVRDGTVVAITGEVVKIQVQSIAIHGDNPSAVQGAKELVAALRAAGIQIKPLREIL